MIITRTCLAVPLFIASLLIVSLSASAHNKVVVIPLYGDEILPTPSASLSADSPADNDYAYNDFPIFGGGTSYDPLLIDTKTKLVWQRVPGASGDLFEFGGANHSEAGQYCADLDYYGHTDWHLPSISELFSLLDTQSTAPTINSAAFINTISGGYWSNTPYIHDFESKWILDFATGEIKTAYEATAQAVRCVRRSFSHMNAKIDNGNGTVSDVASGLMWQQGFLTTEAPNAVVAYTYCNNLSLGSHQDWRLPSIKELMSIVDFSLQFPTTDSVFTANSGQFWSLSQYLLELNHYWFVNLGIGSNSHFNLSANLNARCVRA